MTMIINGATGSWCRWPALTRAGCGSIVAASAAQEAAVIADTLRRAHLMDGAGWSSMAVLVRSATRQVPLLQRALAAAGVPVAVAGDELPLAAEPGTRPLLTLLSCALRPGALAEETAAELLTGPLGGTDALGLRRLSRALRFAAESAGEQVPAQPLAAALARPRDLGLANWPAGWLGTGQAGGEPGRSGGRPGQPADRRAGRELAGRGRAAGRRADRDWPARRRSRNGARGAVGRVGRLRAGWRLAGGQRGGRQPGRRGRRGP